MMNSLCVRCKGKGLCGKPCKILAAARASVASVRNVKEHFSGSSPGVFVGHYGYPRLSLGILSPAFIDERAWILDAPEFWYDKKYPIERILQNRYQLINSRRPTKVKSPPNRLVETAQEIALARKPVESEFMLKKKPRVAVRLDTHNAPLGSVAEVKRVRITENVKIRGKVDYIVSDDLKAEEQINKLYGVIDVNQIQRILSVGLLGEKSQKKLVPTRWSITATDDIVFRGLIKDIRRRPFVNDYLLFENEYLGNHFVILLMPRQWSFEVIEAWRPNSFWSQGGLQIAQDYESFFGRKTYASSVTGGYYAARLAVAEYLAKIRRQASVLVLREISSRYWLPLGVWVVRETVRGCFSSRPMRFATLEDATSEIKQRIHIPWQRRSWLLRELKQKTIKDYK